MLAMQLTSEKFRPVRNTRCRNRFPQANASLKKMRHGPQMFRASMH